MFTRVFWASALMSFLICTLPWAAVLALPFFLLAVSKQLKKGE